MIYGILFFITAAFTVEPNNQFYFENTTLTLLDNKQDQTDTTGEIYDVVEQNAFYNGATTEPQSREFWLKAIKEEAKKHKKKLPENKKVFISVVVYKNATIGEVKLIRGSGDSKLDDFALYCGKNLKEWSPGKHRGEVVNTRIIMPVYIE